MRLDESKCKHQTISLFGDAPATKPSSVPPTPPAPAAKAGHATIYFDGGCLGNPGRKYGSFQVLLDGKQVVGRKRVEFGHGTNNEAEFNSLKLALDEAAGWFRSQGMDLKSLSLLIETDSTIVRNRLVVKNVIFKKYPSSIRMFALANECLKVMKQFAKFEVIWKGRASNVNRFGH